MTQFTDDGSVWRILKPEFEQGSYIIELTQQLEIQVHNKRSLYTGHMLGCGRRAKDFFSSHRVRLREPTGKWQTTKSLCGAALEAKLSLGFGSEHRRESAGCK